MKRFVRNASPDFWREREDAWLESAPRTSGKDAFRNRKYERRTLADWFHELVRPDDHPRNCAYCDGPLGETSPPTIDHFIPEREAPTLGLSRENLYPACSSCNTTYKRDQWDVFLIRPEKLDEKWIEVEYDGELRPAPDLAPVAARYVRYTIEILGLNEPPRPRARARAWQTVVNASRAGNHAFIEQLAAEGPYRLVVERFLASRSEASR